MEENELVLSQEEFDFYQEYALTNNLVMASRAANINTKTARQYLEAEYSKELLDELRLQHRGQAENALIGVLCRATDIVLKIICDHRSSNDEILRATELAIKMHQQLSSANKSLKDNSNAFRFEPTTAPNTFCH